MKRHNRALSYARGSNSFLWLALGLRALAGRRAALPGCGAAVPRRAAAWAVAVAGPRAVAAGGGRWWRWIGAPWRRPRVAGIGAGIASGLSAAWVVAGIAAAGVPAAWVVAGLSAAWVVAGIAPARLIAGRAMLGCSLARAGRRRRAAVVRENQRLPGDDPLRRMDPERRA